MPAVKDLSEAGQPKPYTLDFPVEYDGTEYRAVAINRIRAGDVAKLDRAAGPRALRNVLALLSTPEGQPVPAAVLDGMDCRDGFAIVDMAQPFLERFFPPKPVARFAGAEHARTIALRLPIEFGDRVYDRIVVRRLTALDFRRYFDRPEGERGRLPVCVDEAGDPVPDEVMDALGVDDNAEVMGAVDVFIPGSLRADKAPDQPSAPEPGKA